MEFSECTISEDNGERQIEEKPKSFLVGTVENMSLEQLKLLNQMAMGESNSV